MSESSGWPIQFWLSLSSQLEDLHFLNSQIDRFLDQARNVEVERQLLPFKNYEAKMYEALFTGVDVPDVAALSLNQMVELQRQGLLLPLDQLLNLDLSQFLPDAIESSRIPTGLFERPLFGVPLRRFANAPVYQYLAVFKTTHNLGGDCELLDFFTSETFQKAALRIGWIPTRTFFDAEGVYRRERSISAQEGAPQDGAPYGGEAQATARVPETTYEVVTDRDDQPLQKASAYADGTPPHVAIRTNPEETRQTVQIVSYLAPLLEEFGQLNPHDSVGLAQNGEIVLVASPLVPEGVGDEFEEEQETTACALFFKNEMKFGGATVPPGSYAMKVTVKKKDADVLGEPEVSVRLVATGRKPFETRIQAVARHFTLPLDKPVVAIVPGSTRVGTWLFLPNPNTGKWEWKYVYVEVG